MSVRQEDDDLRRAVAGLPAAGPCPDEARLLAFYRGEFDEARADAVREHLATCPACLVLARDAREFLAAMRAEQPAAEQPAAEQPAAEQPAAERAAAERAAAERPAAERPAAEQPAAPPPATPPSSGVRARPRSRRTPLWAATAAAGMAVAALGLYALRREDRPPPAADVVWRGGDDAAAYDVALEHYRAGRFEAAEAAFETYVLAHPADDQGRLYLALSRMRVGRTADARRELAQLAERGDEAVRAEAKRWLAELDRGGAP